MRLTKAKTIAVTALAVAGIATSGQALARVAPPEADAAAAAALAERVRVAPPEADAATPVALAGTIVRPGAAPEAAPAPITITPGGFDLGDVAIGAGFALGLVLLLVLGIKAVRSRRPLAH